MRLVLLALVAAGCGNDPVCGPGDVSARGLIVETGLGPLTYGDGTSSPNNDCPVDGAPTSLTIEIVQVDPPTVEERALVLCLPRPDQIGSEPIDLADDSRIQVIDIFADEADCLISIDRSRPVSGTATFTGFCDDGTAPDGYALGLSGTIPATRTCRGGDEAIELTLSGELALDAL